MPREREEIETADGGSFVIERGQRGPTEEELREERSAKMARLLTSRKITDRDLGLEQVEYKNGGEVARLREHALEADLTPKLDSHFKRLLRENDETLLEKDEREARRQARIEAGR